MNTQQINFKWVVKHVPIYLQIVFLVLSAISAFEGVLNAVLFGQLTNINFSNIDWLSLWRISDSLHSHALVLFGSK